MPKTVSALELMAVLGRLRQVLDNWQRLCDKGTAQAGPVKLITRDFDDPYLESLDHFGGIPIQVEGGGICLRGPGGQWLDTITPCVPRDPLHRWFVDGSEITTVTGIEHAGGVTNLHITTWGPTNRGAGSMSVIRGDSLNQMRVIPEPLQGQRWFHPVHGAARIEYADHDLVKAVSAKQDGLPPMRHNWIRPEFHREWIYLGERHIRTLWDMVGDSWDLLM